MAFIFCASMLLVIFFILTALSVVLFSSKEEKQALLIESNIRFQMFVNTVRVLVRYYRIQNSAKRANTLQPAFN